MSVAERHMHANMLVVLVVLLGSEQPEVQLLRGLLRRRHELHRIVQPVASLFVRARPWPELRAPTRVSQYVVALMLDLPGFSEFGHGLVVLFVGATLCPDLRARTRVGYFVVPFFLVLRGF